MKTVTNQYSNIQLFVVACGITQITLMTLRIPSNRKAPVTYLSRALVFKCHYVLSNMLLTQSELSRSHCSTVLRATRQAFSFG